MDHPRKLGILNPSSSYRDLGKCLSGRVNCMGIVSPNCNILKGELPAKNRPPQLLIPAKIMPLGPKPQEFLKLV
jgi:hypothetical protein